jgi:hypothetical protein
MQVIPLTPGRRQLSMGSQRPARSGKAKPGGILAILFRLEQAPQHRLNSYCVECLLIELRADSAGPSPSIWESNSV